MFDINKRKNLTGVTVASMIEELKKLPAGAKLFCCGDEPVHVHVSKDDSIVNIDWSALASYYEEQQEEVTSDGTV